MRKIKEIISMPANYVKFVVSRFPEKKTPLIISCAVSLVGLLAWIFSGWIGFGIIFGIGLLVFIGLLSF